MIIPTNQKLAEVIKEFTENNTAFMLSLIETLTQKGLLDDDDLQEIKKRQTTWISRFDQIQASKKDELLNSNSEDGARARMHMAMSSMMEGDFESFCKWLEKDHKIRDDK